MSLNNLLDIKYIKRNTPNYKNLSVSLKKTKTKGTSLFANKDFKKDDVLAYYLITVYDSKNFKSVTNDMYTFTVYTKAENPSTKFIGDLSLSSLPLPCNGIPFWAYFSNEPSGKQTENAYIDINTKYNYGNRKSLKAGDSIVYVLRAKKAIKKNEEIVWCYGKDYVRNYKPNC
jgi:hypothetical protein